MANEISVSAVTGLTISIQLYLGTSAQGVPFSAAEIGATGEYVASMPSSTPYGRYIAVAYADEGVSIGSTEIFWDGNYEITESMAMLRGLDPNNPANQTLTNLTAGDINIEVSGDPASSVTFTRST